MFRCFDVSMFRCFDVSMFRCFDVSMFRCFDVSMFRCFDVSDLHLIRRPQRRRQTPSRRTEMLIKQHDQKGRSQPRKMMGILTSDLAGSSPATGTVLRKALSGLEGMKRYFSRNFEASLSMLQTCSISGLESKSFLSSDRVD